jgi:Tol biopolymer transport system component
VPTVARVLVLAAVAALALPSAGQTTTSGANGRIAFTSTRNGSSSYELYSVRPDGTGLARLTWSAAIEQEPVWSPDGSRLAFGSFAEGRQSIHVMNSDGSGEYRASPPSDSADDAEPSWSPDGSRIAFASTRGGGWGIWVMNADGSGLRPLASGWGTDPAWSPDGTRIAYVNDRVIEVVNADGSGLRQLTSPVNGFSDERPSWSPDGSQLAFARRPTFESTAQLYVISSDGSNERQLTSDGYANRGPSWSPDGTQIVFSRRATESSRTQLYLIAADGSGMRPLLESFTGEDFASDWGTSMSDVVAPPQAPIIEIYSPRADFVYPADSNIDAFYSCDSAVSFVVSCEGDVPLGAPVETQTTGTRTFTVRATDAEGRTATKTVTFQVYDWKPPQLNLTTPADGAEYPLGADVRVAYDCDDGAGGSGIAVCSGDRQPGDPLDTSVAGSYTFTAYAVDRTGNLTQKTVSYRIVNPDNTPPTIVISTPGASASYVLGSSVSADYACSDGPNGSGVSSCSGTVPAGAPLDTATVGDKTFTVTAADRAGNRSTLSRSYGVIYDFGGFFAPLADPPTRVSLKAGDAVPVKFSLGGDRGLGILAGSPSWQRVACDSGATLGDSIASKGTLSYLDGGTRYLYLAKTSATWAGSCYRFSLALADGTVHQANIRFT